MAHEGTSAEIRQYVNVYTAKKVAFILMIGFSAYHGYIMLANGGDSCKWLLSQGRFQGNNYWQPYGCMVHKYSHSDAHMCLQYISYWGGHNNILFAGDSRTRKLYMEFINLFGDQQIYDESTSNYVFTMPNHHLNATFIWSPYVNSTLHNLSKRWLVQEPTLSMVVLGPGLEMLLDANWTNEVIINYKHNLSVLTPNLSKLHNSSIRVLWLLQDPVDDYKLSSTNYTKLTNKMINEFNLASREILEAVGLNIWSSNRLIAQEAGFYNSVDGIKINQFALDWDVQILTNMFCNDRMKFFDGTCCSVPERITGIQVVTFLFFAFWIALSGVIFICDLICHKKRIVLHSNDDASRMYQDVRRVPSNDAKTWFSNLKKVSYALAKLGFVLAYFFVCDRTIFFMKENKAFTVIGFLLPLIYIAILGCFFTEPSSRAGLLHRDITDEWKGWMQLVILIYHMTGASTVLPIYMHIRVLVSAYLFISGFGHFTYFWTSGDAGLSRLCKTRCDWVGLFVHRNQLRRMLEVLFRMNMLVVCLCFVMNRAYQFYYFVPLVSFWFILICLTFSIWPQVFGQTAEANNVHYLYMLIKMIVLVTIVTLLYASEFIFDKIFLTNPLRALFVASDDKPNEWRHRWELDRYSVIYGMLFAFGYQTVLQSRLLHDNHQKDLFPRYASYSCFLLGVVGLTVYCIFSFLCRNKVECNATHSYLVILPIFSYVILRNVLGSVRQKFSTFFAWFGRISLELFIAQYHIWLAADTHGVLVLIPSNQVLNSITTSFIFVCVSHEIQQITAVLLPYAVPDDWRLVLRNMVLFLALLLPIAISHGVFAF